MIEGIVLRDCVRRIDERGELSERYSVNFGDVDLCHAYTCIVRPGIAKGFHAHLLQTDRFTPVGLRGVTKVGLVDLRGALLSRWASLEWRPGLSTWEEEERANAQYNVGHYLGIDGTPKPFREVWPTDAEWIERVGDSPTFLEQQTVILDSTKPQVLFIPPGVAHGIYSLSPEGSEILNAPTVPFAANGFPDELRLPASSFQFQWAPRSG